MHSLFQTIAFTHNQLDVTDIGCLHIAEENQKERLSPVKKHFKWSELIFLSTCNRVEFLFCSETKLKPEFVSQLLAKLYPSLSADEIQLFSKSAELHQSNLAVEHLFKVASSIDSMVVGEREIITQVRNAYELSSKNGLTGDYLRLLTKQTIDVAKKVYTHTNIARNPVSVVSLAYHRLKDLAIPLDARFVIIGAGATNTTLSRFLKKHGYKNFVVFNRTFEKAQQLAKEIKATPFPLVDINEYKKGFDVLIACTGTDGHIVSPELYKDLLQGEKDKKVVIDIAIPQDLHPQIVNEYPVHHISVSMLQKLSDTNLKARAAEIDKVIHFIESGMTSFNFMVKERNVEIAMRSVPAKIKDIKRKAMDDVFKIELDQMDPQSKEVLENILGYMEKKYLSVPMIMAKEILLKKNN
jgi:glutamyl-tRNA reductase